MSLMAWAPKTRREARKWVREHWQTFMLHADVPDLVEMDDAQADLIADVFCDESMKLANRLEPRRRA